MLSNRAWSLPIGSKTERFLNLAGAADPQVGNIVYMMHNHVDYLYQKNL